MQLFRSIFLAVACVTTFSASAAPVSISADLSTRDVEVAALVPRGLNIHKLGQEAVSVLKGQANKQFKKAKKKAVNEKIMSAAPGVKVPEGKTAGKSESERKVLQLEANNKAKSQAITQAQKQAKADRAKKWAEAKGKPGPAPNPPRTQTKLKTDEKTQVKDALHKAGTRMHNTANIPNNKDRFTVGEHTATGKDVRKAVMNSYLHESVPVGQGPGSFPKEFRNDPYNPNHPDAALHGKRPIHNPTGAELHEYPVTKHGQGWVGSGNVGPARVITSSDGGHDTFHGVIGHDKNRGGSKEDHYLATHTPHH